VCSIIALALYGKNVDLIASAIPFFHWYRIIILLHITFLLSKAWREERCLLLNGSLAIQICKAWQVIVKLNRKADGLAAEAKGGPTLLGPYYLINCSSFTSRPSF